MCVRQSDAESITVAPEGGVTDEGDAISAETAEGREGRGRPARPTERNDKDGTA